MKTTNRVRTVHIVGGGLAGVEASWQCLRRGLRVVLHEMRPVQMTEAHKTSNLAELVCSNSFKSLVKGSAAAELKYEMESLDSLVIKAAKLASVPAGNALAVDRVKFSKTVEGELARFDTFARVSEEVRSLPTAEELETSGDVWILATGPLTSKSLAAFLDGLTASEKRLFFYDAIAPTIEADSLDMDVCFVKDRYGEVGKGDYINIPLTKEEYVRFIDDVKASEKVPLHDFEDTSYFESCLPIEVMIERGDDTLRFGPMKPVGLEDKNGKRPWAAVQLRAENLSKTMYSMVGFQTKMKWGEQKRIFNSLPGLQNAEFLRMGSIHRNTYIHGPRMLNQNLSLKGYERVFVAGQLTGVEGYTESAAIGLLAGRNAAALVEAKDAKLPPPGCMIGALADYVTNPESSRNYAPMNANLGLLPPVQRRKGMSKADKKMAQIKRAQDEFHSFHHVRC